MKNILHFNIYKSIPRGVFNQLNDEQDIIRELDGNIGWVTKVFTHDVAEDIFCESVKKSDIPALVGKMKDYISLRITAYQWLIKNQVHYDQLLLRYRMGDIFQVYYSREIVKPYYTIHHTLEVPEARTRGGVLGILEARLEQQLGPKMLKGTSGIIGVTNEIVRYEQTRLKSNKPSYCLPNGISLDGYPAVGDSRSGDIKLLVVASAPFPWHGIDMIIEAFVKSKNKFELHLVGNMDKNQYVDDVRIFYHGMQDRKYISEIAKKCDLGLAAFALFRKNMTEACSLKVREYLALGLPVFSGHIDSGLPGDFPFYKIGGLQVDKILSYADHCRKYSRATVRGTAAPFIDKKNIMKGFIEWLNHN